MKTGEGKTLVAILLAYELEVGKFFDEMILRVKEETSKKVLRLSIRTESTMELEAAVQ